MKVHSEKTVVVVGCVGVGAISLEGRNSRKIPCPLGIAQKPPAIVFYVSEMCFRCDW